MRKEKKILYDLEPRINQAVFPGLQGGPHNNAIAAIATTMKASKSPEFVKYAHQIVANANRLSDGLQSRGYKVVTGGTEVHMLLVDLRSAGLTGAKGEYILEEISICGNKNTNSRSDYTCGLVEKDIDQAVDFIE
ncbi:hypothetical protein NQ317_011944 [Molorchus minor]|uniref:Serine hydroxymethyltransferase-like domain-containing protein n=1 Tax=Molorchus minor TaxID=1323400 RepID=A0ABQ9IQA2_9CUCU|nr:hypothetical protein NQ317_011944 [Molorchus minor]